MLLQGPLWGSGGGQVVSMLAFSSDDLSSNPAGVKSFSIKFVFEKKENNQKEAGDDQFKKYFSNSAFENIKHRQSKMYRQDYEWCDTLQLCR